jgi:hypothetical protein
MSIRNVRSKTLKKFLILFNLTLANGQILTVAEIKNTFDCCQSTAYQYQKALKVIFPQGRFRERRRNTEQERTEGTQQNLNGN